MPTVSSMTAVPAYAPGDAVYLVTAGGLSRKLVSLRVANIAAMTALAVPTNGMSVEVIEEGRGGFFVFDTSATAAGNGGTTFSADDATSGSWVRRINGFVTPEMFGAPSGGDDTALCQDAIDAGADAGVLFGDADYRIDGTLVLTGSKRVTMSPGTILRRLSAGATTPIMRVQGNNNRVDFNKAWLFMESGNSPDGVLLIGPDTSVDSTTINFLTNGNVLNAPTIVDGALLSAVNGSYGIVFYSAGASGSSPIRTTYYNTVYSPSVSGAATSIAFRCDANANVVYDLTARFFKESIVDFEASYANQIIGGFAENLLDGDDTSVRHAVRFLNSTTAGFPAYALGGAQNNQVFMSVETPASSGALQMAYAYAEDTECKENVLIGSWMSGIGQGADLGDNSIINFDSAYIIKKEMRIGGNDRRLKENATQFVDIVDLIGQTDVVENTTEDAFAVTGMTFNRQCCLVEVKAVADSANLDRTTVFKGTYMLHKYSSGIVLTEIGTDTSSGLGGNAITVGTATTADGAKWTITGANNGTGFTYSVRWYISAQRSGGASSLVAVAAL